MDEHRATATARNVVGKVQEGFGKVTGNAKSEIEDKMNEIAGAAEDLYGQAKDTAQEAVKVVKKQASDMEDIVRKAIEDSPYTAVFVALCFGWLIGHLGRTK